MNGPSEFAFTGSLKNYDMSADLHRIRTPTLITCGQFDYGSPACAANLQKGIAGSKIVVYDGLSHMSHIEDPARVVRTVRGYLKSIAV
jgi:pimeloyl-ACP methyl ester carboxylesterase